MRHATTDRKKRLLLASRVSLGLFALLERICALAYEQQFGGSHYQAANPAALSPAG